MVHTIPFQSKELMKSDYFKIRSTMNVEKDIIHLTIANSNLLNMSTEDMYKRVLELEGSYRTEEKKWIAPAVKVRVFKQL